MSNLLEPLTRNGKLMMLAYDQGFEHGPRDLDDKNCDPNYILEIAKNGNYTCVAMQIGTASHYWKPNYSNIPLVLKVNGKTNLGKKAYSVANATVEEAAEIGAKAIGFTIYLGGEYEAEMIHEFSQLRRAAHQHGLAVFAWMYPFMTMPSSNDDELEADIVAYAARVGAELGADVVKIKYPHQPEQLRWIIKNSLAAKAVLSGGDKTSDTEFIAKLKLFMEAGGSGVAVGRNAWQNTDPVGISHQIATTIFGE